MIYFKKYRFILEPQNLCFHQDMDLEHNFWDLFKRLDISSLSYTVST